MKFEELDTRLRVFETAHDLCVLPGLFIVARIDGRNFTRLTKETHKFVAPFDAQFRDYMVSTVEHLMNCGFRIIYGYTQSDEISLLFHRDEESFSRKLRKLNSILAGEASAKLSLLLNSIAAFDCRVSQLPTLNLVVDYFRWRNEDAHRNALNAHCYWMLRKAGESAVAATEKLDRLSVSDKNELLYQQANINFNNLPNWQKRGIGLYWESYQKEATNPQTGEKVLAMRRRIKVDMDLAMKDDYSKFVRDIVLREHPDFELRQLEN
ncbi:guanylyltransferase [Nostoc piscinale CENA21]|uniref:tRNA(His) guanylyltransferase n=1 Tax=Nostoc piscinale CENA21 TaxID=224013 RepID=A0A0M4TX27_9NOSO|nr:tRNA(His) guanylyltransferase Thg1 family protein [Nostoc piscinale]ALF53889.1 guanylyltransferase [Nostoc piscinale CENA21]